MEPAGALQPVIQTEDLAHGQDLDGVVVVNPFRVGPSELE